ncbi:hypothetical protein BpHYR1_035422 [Brachionus plicatilis]|uniref:Uncharacterized protein n=1 Tax=Brachionus plicatilis TaxID=10195 RepID=A0A3M7QEC7_BRAPC|nr:hypothetical protein BpHYR1_035422 [Brachionus plicatilis]
MEFSHIFIYLLHQLIVKLLDLNVFFCQELPSKILRYNKISKEYLNIFCKRIGLNANSCRISYEI